MERYQKDFIDFLIQSGALTFGEFTLKSGRKAPYFINTGKFDDGEKISRLGGYYASHMINQKVADVQAVFGPAYKGIPLAVATASALFVNHKLNVGFAFDRKEVKDHGDKGKLVGKTLSSGEKIVIVEDVITAGTTIREIIPHLKAIGDIKILGLVIAVDRCERGTGDLSAAQQVEKEMGIRVLPIVTIHHIVEHLSNSKKLDGQMIEKISKYLLEYGAKA